MKEELKGAYLKDFATEFSKRNPVPAVGLEALVDNLTPTQIALQHAFITANPNPIGSKNKMAEATARSTYSAAHTRVHPSLEAFRDKLGFYDIFLIDPQSSRIVYTAFKELDFTSSLVDGPAAKTGLGDVYRKVKEAAAADAVALSDYAPYFISYNDQASFIAMPLMDGGKLIGVIAAQMPLDSITEVMTASRKWKSQGLRESGETYLVGSDLLMRTDSRFLLEDKPGFLKALGTSLSAAQLALADKKNTSIGVVKVGSEAAREAIAGKDGVGLVNDYRGLPVFSAYGPVDVLGLRLGVIAEMDEAEALAAATELRNQTIVNTTAIALLVLLVAGVAGYVFVRSITRPVIDLSNLVNEVAKGNDQARSQVKTEDELQDLGDTFNALLDDRIAKLNQAQT
jgi:methyl-accepting chemotaxis protein